MRKAGLLLFMVLGGCTTHASIRPLRPLEIATAPYQELMNAALAGSLMYEGGCLLFHDDQSRAVLLPVWPSGSSFNGTAVLFHRPGKTDQRLMVNEELLVEGRTLQWSELPSTNSQPMQQQCGAYRPFMIASARPAN